MKRNRVYLGLQNGEKPQRVYKKWAIMTETGRFVADVAYVGMTEKVEYFTMVKDGQGVNDAWGTDSLELAEQTLKQIKKIAVAYGSTVEYKLYDARAVVSRKGVTK